MEKQYVVCYDISLQKTRAKVARLLEEYGVRVQKSVFAVCLHPAELATLKSLLQKHITGQDMLCVLPLCANCYGQAQYIGPHISPVLVV